MGPKPPRSLGGRVRWGLVLRAVVSVGLLAWVGLQIGPAAAAQLGAVSPLVAVASLALFGCAHLWSAARLYVLLRAQGEPLGFWYLLGLTLLGNFVSNFLPGSVGG